MTPGRLFLFVSAMSVDPSKTVAQIKASLALVKASAMQNPDSPAREHDVAYYCDHISGIITALELTSPPHSSDQIKAILVDRIAPILREP